MDASGVSTVRPGIRMRFGGDRELHPAAGHDEADVRTPVVVPEGSQSGGDVRFEPCLDGQLVAVIKHIRPAHEIRGRESTLISSRPAYQVRRLTSAATVNGFLRRALRTERVPNPPGASSQCRPRPLRLPQMKRPWFELKVATKLLAVSFGNRIVKNSWCMTIEILTGLGVQRFPVFDLCSRWPIGQDTSLCGLE